MTLSKIGVEQVEHEVEPLPPPLPPFRVGGAAIEGPAHDAEEIATALPDAVIPVSGSQAHQATLVGIWAAVAVVQTVRIRVGIRRRTRAKENRLFEAGVDGAQDGKQAPQIHQCLKTNLWPIWLPWARGEIWVNEDGAEKGDLARGRAVDWFSGIVGSGG